jgi:hypothetical protein
MGDRVGARPGRGRKERDGCEFASGADPLAFGLCLDAMGGRQLGYQDITLGNSRVDDRLCGLDAALSSRALIKAVCAAAKVLSAAAN